MTLLFQLYFTMTFVASVAGCLIFVAGLMTGNERLVDGGCRSLAIAAILALVGAGTHVFLTQVWQLQL